MWTGDPIKSFLWISLFLSTIFVWTANSYGDFEDDNLENNGNARVQMSYEDTMKTIDRQHRVRRAPGDPTGMTGLATGMHI